MNEFIEKSLLCGMGQRSTSKLSGCSHFSKVDLVRTYHHILVAVADRLKTAISFGLYEFSRHLNEMVRWCTIISKKVHESGSSRFRIRFCLH